MNSLWAIVYGSGLQDGLNPCVFMTCAFFIVQGLWLKRNSLRAGWLRIAFVLIYVFSFMDFNFGPLQVFIFQKKFIFAARLIYFVLGVWAFISGVLFFKDWFLCYRGASAKEADDKIPSSPGKALSIALITVIVAAGLGALATLGPVNSYIVFLSYEALLKGQWKAVMPLLTGYAVFSLWPLWFVWVFLSMKNLRPSLLKILFAAVFFTASSCMIFIFK